MKAMWTRFRNVEFETWWYVNLPLGFKRLRKKFIYLLFIYFVLVTTQGDDIL
jgi:hypothetical protein